MAQAVAAMPLEEKIDRVLVSRSEPEYATVTAPGFERTAKQTGLRLYVLTSAIEETNAAAGGVAALSAGYDVLVGLRDADAVFWGIAAAVDRGDLPLDRLDAAVGRLLLTLGQAGRVRPRG